MKRIPRILIPVIFCVGCGIDNSMNAEIEIENSRNVKPLKKVNSAPKSIIEEQDEETQLGRELGPCTARVECSPGHDIVCSGFYKCVWKFQPKGFVSCDEFYYSC